LLGVAESVAAVTGVGVGVGAGVVGELPDVFDPPPPPQPLAMSANKIRTSESVIAPREILLCAKGKLLNSNSNVFLFWVF